jgi:hypothetical protein
MMNVSMNNEYVQERVEPIPSNKVKEIMKKSQRLSQVAMQGAQIARPHEAPSFLTGVHIVALVRLASKGHGLAAAPTG